MSLVEIEHGPWACRVAATWGGRLLSFTGNDGQGQTHFMRPAADDGEAPTGCACFPLVPFSNRIAAGRFEFQGRDVTLPRNFDRGNHAIHGYGWMNEWHVAAQSDTGVTLVFQEDGRRHWPWAYRSTQTFQLTDQGLTITLTVQNLADEDMPGGLGLHPYFNSPDGTTVRLNATGIIEKDSKDLPIRIDPSHSVLTGLKEGSAVQRGLDTGIEGWDGKAIITWPDTGRSMQVDAPGVTRAVYFTPLGKGFFCLEPVTHMTNAHNSTLGTDAGLKVLAPQETMSLETSFNPVS